jgi:hypothetical protein
VHLNLNKIYTHPFQPQPQPQPQSFHFHTQMRLQLQPQAQMPPEKTEWLSYALTQPQSFHFQTQPQREIRRRICGSCAMLVRRRRGRY